MYEIKLEIDKGYIKLFQTFVDVGTVCMFCLCCAVSLVVVSWALGLLLKINK